MTTRKKSIDEVCNTTRSYDPEQVLKTTFERRGHGNTGWGWRIPNNPERVLGEFTDEEKEVHRILDGKEAQTREISRVKTYTYWAPFNYPNITVELGREATGCEFNNDGAELDIPPYGAITVTEEEPIVAVSVIGSGCSYHSYVMLEAEPLVWKYPRTGIRMKAMDLYGAHVRGDVWEHTGEKWNDAGLSSARFEIPDSRRVIIMGGSLGSDPHYCVRLIRVDVKDTAGS